MSNEDTDALRYVLVWVCTWIVGTIVGYVALWLLTIALDVGDYGETVYWIAVCTLLASTCALGVWLAGRYAKHDH
jgi:hypothetical protein